MGGPVSVAGPGRAVHVHGVVQAAGVGSAALVSGDFASGPAAGAGNPVTAPAAINLSGPTYVDFTAAAGGGSDTCELTQALVTYWP